jgi:hypothetical protein
MDDSKFCKTSSAETSMYCHSIDGLQAPWLVSCKNMFAQIRLLLAAEKALSTRAQK